MISDNSSHGDLQIELPDTPSNKQNSKMNDSAAMSLAMLNGQSVVDYVPIS